MHHRQSKRHTSSARGSICDAHLEVQVHQVALVEVVNSLQHLPDQTGDLGLGQQLVRHAVVEYLAACRAGKGEKWTLSIGTLKQIGGSGGFWERLLPKNMSFHSHSPVPAS